MIGTFSEHPRYGPQVAIHELVTPLEVDWDRLLDAPATPIRELEHQLDALLETIRDRHLRALTEHLLGAGSTTGRAFRHAFAAQYNHHANRAGLHATAAAPQPGIWSITRRSV